ncbi:MAG TPA: hypothetical protein VMW74_05065 [Nitrosopumilaceae archaeon]|nr:hypothetical protein [Nitrosopumilaceae archaeon]
MNEEQIKEYDEVFDFMESALPDWERLVTDGNIKIKTNSEKVQFTTIEQILKKFNLRITDISFTQYYGIVFGIEKLESTLN